MTAKTTPRMAGVDSHAHLFHQGLPLADVRRYSPDYDATADDYLAQLAKAGLSHGVLVQPSFLGTDNHFMLDALRRHPDRLRGIAVIDPRVDDDELEIMDACGVVGARLNLIGLPLPDYRDEPWAGLFRRLAQKDWLVEIHRQARDLSPIVGQLLDSGVRIVIDHFGRPDPALGINDPGFHDLLSLAETGRVWVKLSAAYRNDSSIADAVAMTTMLRDSFGPGLLLWGSDWPHTQFEGRTSYQEQHGVLERLLPDAAGRRAVLVDNPAALFRFT